MCAVLEIVVLIELVVVGIVTAVLVVTAALGARPAVLTSTTAVLGTLSAASMDLGG